MKTYIFVRHGKTLFNEQKITQGRVDSPLSPLGIKQVETLRDQLDLRKIDEVYVSPLGRAKQTAQILVSNQKTLHIDTRLKELDFGIFDGKKEWIKNLFTPITRGMYYKLFGGNNPKDLIEAQRSLLSGLEEDKVYLLVGHGCSIYAISKYLLHNPILPFPKNASTTIIEENNGQYVLKKHFSAFF